MTKTVLKHFVKDGDIKFYRYPCEPECQRRWILPGIRCDWGSNRAYPRMEQLFCRRFALITTLKLVPVALEGFDDPFSESNSSTFTDGLNLWRTLAIMCGFSGAFFLRQLQSWNNWTPTTTFTAVMCGQFFEKNDFCMLCWSPVMSHSW